MIVDRDGSILSQEIETELLVNAPLTTDLRHSSKLRLPSDQTLSLEGQMTCPEASNAFTEKIGSDTFSYTTVQPA